MHRAQATPGTYKNNRNFSWPGVIKRKMLKSAKEICGFKCKGELKSIEGFESGNKFLLIYNTDIENKKL